MAEWYKRTAIALVVVGLFLVFGGWIVEPSGDVTLAFPLWLYFIGFILITGGLWVYLVNRR